MGVVALSLMTAACGDNGTDTAAEVEGSSTEAVSQEVQDARAYLDSLVDDLSDASPQELEAVANDLVFNREGRGLEAPEVSTMEIQEAMAVELTDLGIGEYDSAIKAPSRAIYDPEARVLMLLGGGGSYWFAYDPRVEPVVEVDGLLEAHFTLEPGGSYVPKTPEDAEANGVEFALTSCRTSDLLRTGSGQWSTFELGMDTSTLLSHPFTPGSVTATSPDGRCEPLGVAAN